MEAVELTQRISVSLSVLVLEEQGDRVVRTSTAALERDFLNVDSIIAHIVSLLLAAGVEIPEKLIRQYMGAGDDLDP